MATVDKIRRDLKKTNDKITQLQARRKVLEAQLTEAENLEIVQLVKAVKMDNKELSAFLKAYASGKIVLPDDHEADDVAENYDGVHDYEN